MVMLTITIIISTRHSVHRIHPCYPWWAFQILIDRHVEEYIIICKSEASWVGGCSCALSTRRTKISVTVTTQFQIYRIYGSFTPNVFWDETIAIVSRTKWAVLHRIDAFIPAFCDWDQVQERVVHPFLPFEIEIVLSWEKIGLNQSLHQVKLSIILKNKWKTIWTTDKHYLTEN